jgi:hypothetical protein
MVQQMIISAFSALGISGKKHKLNFPLDSAHNKQWLMDSAASNHMTNNENGLYNVRKYMGNQHIQVANGDNLPILSIGNLGSYFKNIFVSPKLSTSLLSVGQMVENDCEIHFDRHGCCVQDQVSGKVIAKGPKVGRLFPIQFSIPSINSCAYSTVINNPHFWHKKLGHPNSNVLTHLMKHGYLGNKNSFSIEFLDCSSCKLGKSKALSFPSHGSRASKCFEIIHTDVWGVSPVISHAQYKYFVTFIDDFSRFTWIYFLRSKADVFLTFQAFVVFVENQFSAHIKILRFDSGGGNMCPKNFRNISKTKGFSLKKLVLTLLNKIELLSVRIIIF